MLDFCKKIVPKIFYLIFVGLFLISFSQLFFEKQTNVLFASFTGYFDRGISSFGEHPHLKIIYPEEPESLEPTVKTPVVRQRLNNIYEPLVKFDRDLKMGPALAVSWGLLDETTWDFRLRPDVVFHNGSSFGVDDVVASINRALKHESSQLGGLLASIKSIESIDNYRFRISTHLPDPLLLQRLSSVLIIPAEYENEEDFDPVGTGSYRFYEWDRGDKIVLKKFEDYWGDSAKFDVVDMISRANKNERVMMFLRGDADFLAFVPFDAVDAITEREFRIERIPSLEVQFLLFNMESGILSDAERRKVVSLAIDQEGFSHLLGGYAHPISQFVSNGVFGFNPDIKFHEYDLEKASDLAEELNLKGKTLSLHLPKELVVLGEHVRKQLGLIDIFVVVSYLEPADFLGSLFEGKADIYFLGFRAEIGDSANFVDVLVHTDAEFNVINYSNPKVDSLIEKSFVELDPSVRIQYLQEIMMIIIEEDIFGVPLFEYDTLYSFSERLDFKPRIDGYIYFDELHLK